MKENIKKILVACNQCQSTNYTIVASDKDREFPEISDDIFNMVQCANCGLHYLNPRPDISALSIIYPKNYQAYNIRMPAVREEKKPFVIRLRHKIYSKRFKPVLKHLNHLKKIDMLDVGCGDGWQLDLYKQLAPQKINTFGVEIREEACQVAESYGHKTYCGLFENLDFNGQQFDLINLSQVIEHVADPKIFMQHIFKVLKPGGILALETPNTNSLDAKIFRSRHWGAYHFPRHWTLYDPSSIKQLGESTGFMLRELYFTPSPVHWVWTINSYLISKGNFYKKIARWIFTPLGVFHGSVRTFILLSSFTLVDIFFKLTTGQASNMMAVFQKSFLVNESNAVKQVV